MESKSLIFKNDEFGTIRTVEIDDKIYFVGIDVAAALGYQYPTTAVSRHCRGWTFHPLSDNQGFTRDTKVIPEGDVYRLIIRSKLPQAVKFESWIFDEVIPSIRKTGGYSVKPASTLELFNLTVKVLNEHEGRLQTIETEIIDVKNQLRQIEAKTTTANSDYLTVAAWCNLHGFRVTDKQANYIGRLMSERSRQLGYPILKVPDSRWGTINAYLLEVFDYKETNKINKINKN